MKIPVFNYASGSAIIFKILSMNRQAWILAKRRSSVERMNHMFAPVYDENWGASITPTHLKFLERFMDTCPKGGLILDAACGTGKFWPMLREKGFPIYGIDQSSGMLSIAAKKFPDVRIEKVGLQEMGYLEKFDGAICIDAMENVFPEDWPTVMTNFYKAIKSGAHLYFTVEITREEEIERAFKAGMEAGIPVLYGEWGHEEGYHYYPSIKQVKDWVTQAGFQLLVETVKDEYHHFLVRR